MMIEKTTVLVLGGVRSGKSRYAESLSSSWPEDNKVYIATFDSKTHGIDDEMSDRIKKHQEQRGPHWKTLECTENLSKTLNSLSNKNSYVLVDCLTLWLAGIIDKEPSYIEQEIKNLENSVRDFQGTLVMVSGEVGWGLVSDNAMSRLYRDFHGVMNQKIAAASKNVFMVIAGIPQTLKEES